MNRCVNIDWLEVLCFEPVGQELDAAYFRSKNYVVKEREYGTPVYKQMFTILMGGREWLEIRRQPHSLKPYGGIFEEGMMHIRLCNRTCYAPDPVEELSQFILRHRIRYRAISRVDICMDFNSFDNRMKPQTLITKYMKGEVAKLNQSKLAAHGRDSWDEGRTWNSLKWGAPSSPISTKLYNKTLEMKEVRPKYYIQDMWADAGLMNTEEDPVWRVEFSIKTEGRRFVKIDKDIISGFDIQLENTRELELWLMNDPDSNPICVHQIAATRRRREELYAKMPFYEISLDTIRNGERLLHLFHTIASHYFHFKVPTLTLTGVPQRKDRCPDVPLFKISKYERAFKRKAVTMDEDPSRMDKIILNRLEKIVECRENWHPVAVNAARELLPHFNMRYRLKKEGYVHSLLFERGVEQHKTPD